MFLFNGFVNFKYVNCYFYIKNNFMRVIFFIICINFLDYIYRSVNGELKDRNRFF